MKYTIKEFSEHLGITTDTLRLYEKQGIVKPIIDVKNKYRYFDDLDARNLLACRWYRSLDIPLKEAARLTVHADDLEICRALSDKKTELKNEIERLTALSKVIEDTCDLIDVQKCEDYSVKQIPEMVRFVQTHGNTLISDSKAYRQEAQNWMEALPSVFYTFKGDLTESGGVTDYTWGMAMPKKAFDKRLMTDSQSLEYMPEMTCLTTVMTSPYEEFLPNNAFEMIIKKAETLGFDHQGFVFGRLIVSTCFEKTRRSYIELMLPIVNNVDTK